MAPASGWLIDDAERLATLRSFGILDTPTEEAFDAIVAEAAGLCETPVSLITLLDHERQWFKARHGTEITETPIELAVCAHVLAKGGTLVIPDLTADARTDRNPLVTDAPSIRFYAGVPLVVDGQALGALCVIDLVPRPQALGESQRQGLEALAVRAAELIKARR